MKFIDEALIRVEAGRWWKRLCAVSAVKNLSRKAAQMAAMVAMAAMFI